MKLLAVSIGRARPTPGRVSAKTGIFKEPVDYPVMIGKEGLAGDRIVNRKLHGGPEQAVYMECAADLAWWAEQYGRPIPPGTFGENLVIDGLSNAEIAIGDRFEIGDVLLEVTSARTPCSTFAARMDDPMIVKRYTKAARPGVYLRVLKEGIVRAGDAVVYTPFQGERITMPEFLRDFGRRFADEQRLRYRAVPLNSRYRNSLDE